MLKIFFRYFSIQSFEILTSNRSSFSLSVFVGVIPLQYLLGPVGDIYCLSNTFRMLVQMKFSWIYIGSMLSKFIVINGENIVKISRAGS